MMSGVVVLCLEEPRIRFLIVAHVGVVEIGQQPHRTRPVRDAVSAGLELQVFRTRPRNVGVEVLVVGHLRHQRFGKTRRPPVIVVLQHRAVGVAARVGGVVVGAVRVYCRVEELQVTVGGIGIHIEEIDQIELAEAEFDAPRGKACCQMKLVPVRFNALLRQRDDLAQHEARQIGALGKRQAFGQMHGIHVGIAGQAIRIPDAAARRIFQVGKYFGRVRELVAGVKRQHVRG